MRIDNRAIVDVMSPSRRGRGRPGIVVHRATDLQPRDTEVVDGIRCTSVARTLLDLAEVIDRRGLERALDRAEQLRIFDMNEINDVLSRAQGRRGASILSSLLAVHVPGSTPTRTDIEELMLAICRTAGIPHPKVNHDIALPDNQAYQGDFVWPEHRLIVETDGHETHGTRLAFEHDRERDQRLAVQGWRVIRFTWRQILEQPQYVAQTLRALLAQAEEVAA